MIPLRLIHEHHEDLIDAAHQGLLLQIDALQRMGLSALARRRQELRRRIAAGPADLAASAVTFEGFDRAAMDDVGQAIAIAGDTYARWSLLCEAHWRRAHDRMRAAIAFATDHAPPEVDPAMRAAAASNDLATAAAEIVASGSREAVVGTAAEIASAMQGTSTPKRRPGRAEGAAVSRRTRSAPPRRD